MYSKDKLGVAIKTSHERLIACFDNASEDIYIGDVTYYDDSKPFYRIGNTFYSFLVKHNYYEFESEVRCITENKDGTNSIFKKITIDLNTLIEEIYISPLASQVGFKGIIEFLRDKHNLAFNVKISGVNDNWL